MIKGFESVNLPVYISSSQQTVRNDKQASRNMNVSGSNAIKISGALVGLAVLGYAGVRILKGRAPDIKPNNTIPEECLLRFRNWFDEIKFVKSHIWQKSKEGQIQECVVNPNRMECISFLDNLSPIEKRAFVQEYCNLTGFPKLESISNNIDKEILSSLNKMIADTDNRILFAGYDKNCSVGRQKAFPGGDCDGLFIVVEKPLSEKVNRAILGDLMNQRIINSTGEHYPEVFELDDLIKSFKLADDVFNKISNPEKIKSYTNNITYDGKSYIKAAEFNIDIAENITDKFQKDMVCQAGFFAETLRAGKLLVNNLSEEDYNFIKNSALYKYSNMTRQEGLKNKVKPKLENRMELCAKFNQMNDDEKFDVCVDLLKNSFGIKSQNTTKEAFIEFDMGDIIEMYKKVSSFFG